VSDLTNSPNHFLASLSPDDGDVLRPHLRRDKLAFGSVLHDAEQQIPRVYFPTAGIISLVVGLSDGQVVEAGMFGRNGVVGGAGQLSTAGLPSTEPLFRLRDRASPLTLQS